MAKPSVIILQKGAKDELIAELQKLKSGQVALFIDDATNKMYQVDHSGAESVFATSVHNHKLAELEERSYHSLTDIPTEFNPSPHNHDTQYYPRVEIDSLLAQKADLVHTHSDLASIAYVDSRIDELVNNAQTQLDTLNQIQQELAADTNSIDTILTQLGNKADIGHTHDFTTDVTNRDYNALDNRPADDDFANLTETTTLQDSSSLPVYVDASTGYAKVSLSTLKAILQSSLTTGFQTVEIDKNTILQDKRIYIVRNTVTSPLILQLPATATPINCIIVCEQEGGFKVQSNDLSTYPQQIFYGNEQSLEASTVTDLVVSNGKYSVLWLQGIGEGKYIILQKHNCRLIKDVKDNIIVHFSFSKDTVKGYIVRNAAQSDYHVYGTLRNAIIETDSIKNSRVLKFKKGGKLYFKQHIPFDTFVDGASFSIQVRPEASVSKQNYLVYTPEMALYFTEDFKIHFRCQDVTVDSKLTITPGQWNHVVVCVSTNKIQMYLNGQLDAAKLITLDRLPVTYNSYCITGNYRSKYDLKASVDDIIILDTFIDSVDQVQILGGIS